MDEKSLKDKFSKENLYVLGIDPGLAKSCGWAVLKIKMPPNDSNDPSDSSCSCNCQVLCNYQVLDCGVINLNKTDREKAALELSKLAKTYKVSEIMIEDFHYWRSLAKSLIKKTAGGHKRKSSYYTVARMQNLIGFLCGFFCAKNFNVTIVSPIRWRTRITQNELEKIELPCNFPKTIRPHILSAIGIALGELYAKIEKINKTKTKKRKKTKTKKKKKKKKQNKKNKMKRDDLEKS